jgi:hypothetical protein
MDRAHAAFAHVTTWVLLGATVGLEKMGQGRVDFLRVHGLAL